MPMMVIGRLVLPGAVARLVSELFGFCTPEPAEVDSSSLRSGTDVPPVFC